MVNVHFAAAAKTPMTTDLSTEIEHFILDAMEVDEAAGQLLAMRSTATPCPRPRPGQLHARFIVAAIQQAANNHKVDFSRLDAVHLVRALGDYLILSHPLWCGGMPTAVARDDLVDELVAALGFDRPRFIWIIRHTAATGNSFQLAAQILSLAGFSW
jgi:hypothetical protein